MLTFEGRVLCGNQLQRFGSGLEPDLEPTWESGPVANTKRKHSSAAFLLKISLLSIRSVLLWSFWLLITVSLDIPLAFLKDFYDFFNRLIHPVVVVPEVFKANISLNCLDSFKNCSVLSNTWSSRLSSVRSLEVADTSRGSCSDDFVSFWPWSLSIWEINSCSSPIIEANHHTHCAMKICWVRLGWAITHSKAYTIMSLSFSKVTGINPLKINQRCGAAATQS